MAMDNPFLQRRYLVGFEARRLGHIFTDVLVIGAGAAGLRAAIEAAEFGEVIVATKDTFTESNTSYAQGGLAAVLDDADSVDDHIADTIRTACGNCTRAPFSIHAAASLRKKIRRARSAFRHAAARRTRGMNTSASSRYAPPNRPPGARPGGPGR